MRIFRSSPLLKSKVLRGAGVFLNLFIKVLIDPGQPGFNSVAEKSYPLNNNYESQNPSPGLDLSLPSLHSPSGAEGGGSRQAYLEEDIH